MARVLVIDSSVRFNDSLSREFTGIVANRIKGEKGKIIRRDLTSNIHFINEQSLSSIAKSIADRTAKDSQNAALSDTLIEELEWADCIVIGAPMYNFGPSASLKAWADWVARVDRTFKYSNDGPVGLLVGKKAYIIAVTGGTSVNSHIDFMTPWLKHFLSFIGITDIDLIAVDGVYQNDGEEKIKKAKEKIEEIVV